MKVVKYSLIALLLAGAVVFFPSCSSDDPAPVEEKDGIIADMDDPDFEVSALQGEITGSITLAASSNWILTGPLVVNSGGTLTIEAGTTIKAAAGGTNVYIAVERDGTINAVGTAVNPIKITSNAAAPASGDWGGLLLMGYAPITGNGSAVTEVVDFIYGGDEPTDDSGDIAYLVLEYTGARINGEKEFNGLTLYGVGSGTSISHVALLHGDDDGIEMFGGTVSFSNLLVVNAKDDMFDWTQGWTGTGTNLYGLREAGFDAVTSDPRGIEADGNLDGLTPGLTPQAFGTITNITIENRSTTQGLTDIFKIRRGSKAVITNALVKFGATTPAPGDIVDMNDGAGNGDATSTFSIKLDGTNLDSENNVNGPEATINFNDTNTGVENPSTLFSWTGYTSF